MSSILEDQAIQGRGIALSAQGTPLQRLHYFDGKFLRADNLRDEQAYLRTLAAFANIASGVGVVYGFEVESAGGDDLVFRPGLATDAGGRTLLLQSSESVSLTELIAASREVVGASSTWAAPGAAADPFAECDDEAVVDDAAPVDDLYVVTAHPSDRLCGTEDVYGLLCEQACYTDTQHPWVREGVLLRARPLRLVTALAESTTVDLSDDRYRRSRVASAFFADERGDPASLVSKAGLLGGVWCRGAAARVGEGVPLAVVGRRGGVTSFLDLWTVRRERMEGSPRRYWASRLAMRPWDVFLAQVLQFQCQLAAGGLDPDDPGSGEDDCRDAVAAAATLAAELQQEVADAREAIEKKAVRFVERGEAERAEAIRAGAEAAMAEKLVPLLVGRMGRMRADLSAFLTRTPRQRRILLSKGIVELPPAGYLPVATGDVPVERQVRDLMGEGVDLRFCAVRPDFVGHAFEEAQHMDRISLVQGLDDPAARPRVDVLVPDGEVVRTVGPTVGRGYAMKLAVETLMAAGGKRPQDLGEGPKSLAWMREERRSFGFLRTFPAFQGAGRSEALPGGGAAFHFAGLAGSDPRAGLELLRRCLDPGGATGEVIEIMKATAWTGMAKAALRFGGQPAADAPAPPPEGAPPRIVEEVVVQPEPAEEPEGASAAAVWTSMLVEKDPFAMAAGETTNLSLELYLVVAGGATPLQRRTTLLGTLVVEEPAAAAGLGRVVRGALSGSVEGFESEDVSGAVLLRRIDGAGEPTVEVSLDGRKLFSLSARRAWSSAADAFVCGERSIVLEGTSLEELKEKLGDRAEEMAERMERAARKRPLFAAEQRLDPAALLPGSAAYADAVDALDLFREADPGLAAVWQTRLFGKEPGPGADARILHKHGWVMFHRRREKDCGEAPPTPVVTARDRYRAFRAVVSAKGFERLRKAFDGGDEAAIASVRWESLGGVEYREGERTPFDGGAGLQGAWDVRTPANTPIQLAAIGSDDYDATGGKALAEGRLGKALGALGRTAQVGATETTVLPSAPAAVQAPGSAGVLLFVTLDDKLLDVEPIDDVVLDEVPVTSALRVKVVDTNDEPVVGADLRIRTCGPTSIVGMGNAGKCTSPSLLTNAQTGGDGIFQLAAPAIGHYEVKLKKSELFTAPLTADTAVVNVTGPGIVNVTFTVRV